MVCCRILAQFLLDSVLSKMSGLKVLVAGASIAGPATAYWLAKAGAKVTVIERFPSIRIGGQAVDIRTAGVTVMRRMAGMEALVRAKSTQEEGISIVDDDGRPLGIIRATGNADQQSLLSEFEILRGDLAKILFDLTKDDENINYVFGEQIASIRQDGEDGAEVEFANGMPASKFDLVVACDGATSRTRAIGLQCGVRDHIIPWNQWTAYFSIKQDLLEGSKIGYGHNAVGGRLTTINNDPAGFSRVMMMSIYPRSKPEATVPFRQAAAQGDVALRQYIAAHFSDAGWFSEVVTKEMMSSDDFYASENVQVKLPSLYQGRFALVGDAGHASGPSGGGTSLALAGGYVLAGELSKHDGDVEAGLRAYDQTMTPIAREMQNIPPFLSAFAAPQSTRGIYYRNQLFAFIAWTGIAEFLGKFGKYISAAFGSTDDYPLYPYAFINDPESQKPPQKAIYRL